MGLFNKYWTKENTELKHNLEAKSILLREALKDLRKLDITLAAEKKKTADAEDAFFNLGDTVMDPLRPHENSINMLRDGGFEL